jgi:hypothetical protein
MTGAGITLYLTYLHSYMLAVLTLAVFAPLIGFHFVMARLSKSEDYCSSSTCLTFFRYTDRGLETHTSIHESEKGNRCNDAKN